MESPGERPEHRREWLKGAADLLLTTAKVLLLVVTLVIGVAILGVGSCLWVNRHRSDAEMSAHFLRHETEFEKLVAMFQHDSTLKMIQPNFVQDPASYGTRPHDPHPSLPKERYGEYRRLFRVLGLRFGINRYDHWPESPPDELILRATTQWVFDRKGYIYSPTHELPSTTMETTSDTESPRTYKRIKERWYIYFQPAS